MIWRCRLERLTLSKSDHADPALPRQPPNTGLGGSPRPPAHHRQDAGRRAVAGQRLPPPSTRCGGHSVPAVRRSKRNYMTLPFRFHTAPSPSGLDADLRTGSGLRPFFLRLILLSCVRAGERRIKIPRVCPGFSARFRQKRIRERFSGAGALPAAAVPYRDGAKGSKNDELSNSSDTQQKTSRLGGKGCPPSASPTALCGVTVPSRNTTGSALIWSKVGL